MDDLAKLVIEARKKMDELQASPAKLGQMLEQIDKRVESLGKVQIEQISKDNLLEIVIMIQALYVSLNLDVKDLPKMAAATNIHVS